MFSWMRKSSRRTQNGQQLPDSVSVSCRYRANKRQPRQEGNRPGQRSHTHSGRPTGASGSPRNTPTGTAPCSESCAYGTDRITSLGSALTLADGRQGQRSMRLENQYEYRIHKKHRCGNLPTPTCDVTMHEMVVPYSSNVCENSLVQWNVWIHRLSRANVSTMSPALVGRNFSSVYILLSFMLCRCNVMSILMGRPCKRHHGHCMISPPTPAPAPALFHGCCFTFTAPCLWPVPQAHGLHLLWSCQTTALPSLLLTGDAWTSQVWQCLGHHAPPCLLGRTFNLWPACQLNTLGLRALSSTTSRSLISAIASS